MGQVIRYKTLRVDRTEHALTVTIDRPDKLNALSEVVLEELAELCIKVPSGVRGMLLTGGGDRAFVAGADIKRMSEMTPAQGVEFGRLGQRVTELIESLPFPVIACVNGFALGGGCELAMAADFIYATESAVFGQPEVKLGLIPGFGGCVRLIRLVGPARAKELIYTGRDIGAQEAQRIGLVNAVFSSRAAMLSAAAETLHVIAQRGSIAVTTCKDILRSLQGRSTAAQLALENAGFGRVFTTDDKREGVAAFLAKRTPCFPAR